MLESWDEVFHMLHACTKRCAPLLHQTMYEACDMRNQGIIGAHYDGPRAWRILDEQINAGERTKADKLYYDKCIGAQKASRLHDNCNSDVYAKRANRHRFCAQHHAQPRTEVHTGGRSRVHCRDDAAESA